MAGAVFPGQRVRTEPLGKIGDAATGCHEEAGSLQRLEVLEMTVQVRVSDYE